MPADLALLANLLARVSARSLHLRWDLALGSLEELLAQGLGLAAPFLLKATIDHLSDPAPSLFALCGLTTAFVFAWTASSLFTALKLLHTNRIVDRLQRQISGCALTWQLPALAAHDTPDSGRLASVLERLPQSLQLVIDGLLWRAAPQILQLVVGLALVGWTLPPRYGGLLATTLLAYVLATRVNARAVVDAAAKANLIVGDTAALRADILRNAARVVCNGALPGERSGLDVALSADHRAGQGLARRIVAGQAAQYLVLCLGLSSLLSVAGVDIVSGQLKVGDFVLLQAFALRLALPLGALVMTLRQSSLALANIRDALDLGQPPVVAVSTPSPRPRNTRPGLILSHAHYHYPAGGGVEDISVDLAPDQLVVIVGANGSGKSTLARLMAGLIRPQHGGLFIDGAPLRYPSGGDASPQVLYVIFPRKSGRG